MDLTELNCIVLDLECFNSAQDCRWCFVGREEHVTLEGDPNLWCQPARTIMGPQRTFEPIGWNDHRTLGISIGCYYAYKDGLLHWFDQANLLDTMWTLIGQRPLIVSWNGRAFDGPLMLACLDDSVTATGKPATDLPELWQALWDASYDMLAAIWNVDPERKFEKGLNSLGAVSVANGHGSKEMDGALAPQLWRQGQYAAVISYNVLDVLKTKALFEQIIATGTILRGDGKPISLPLPQGWVVR